MDVKEGGGVDQVDLDLARCAIDEPGLDENLNENKANALEETQIQLEANQVAETLESIDHNTGFGLSLDNLPIEVFLHICSFLDSGFLLQSVSLVCKHFYCILSNEKTWKIRQEKRWGRNGKYPPVQVDEETYSWSRACWKREEQTKLWGSNGANLRNVELRKHIACVDAVHLFEGGTFLATGSRDRSIIIWNVEKALHSFEVSAKAEALPGSSVTGSAKSSSNASRSIAVSPQTPAIASNSAVVHQNATAHKGWIWAFASNHQYILSASWDNTVRVWDKNSGFQRVGELSTQRVACLCLAMTENLIACGTYDKKVLLFDPRDGTYKQVGEHRLHKRCVLALGMDDTRIISCSEDGTTINYDIRAQKSVKNIKLPDGAYPTCLSFRREDPAPLFYLGDRMGRIHLVNSDAFEIVKTYDIGHKQIVQGVFHSLGSVMSCSRDGHLKVLEPSLGLNELATLEINSELPGVHSVNNTVALAGGDSVVRLWAPKEDF